MNKSSKYVVLVLAAVCLGGCNSGGSASPSSNQTTSPSPTVSPSPIPSPALNISLLLESRGIESNGTNYAYISRSGTAAVTVSLVSSDPSKMTVTPVSVSFAPGSANPIPVLLKGVTSGTATLLATASGYSESTSAYSITAPAAFSCVADLNGATNETKLCGCLNENDGSGLMWYSSTLTNGGNGYTFAAESVVLATFNSGSGHCGHTDWRIPTAGTTDNSYGYFCDANIDQTTDFGKLGCYAISKGYTYQGNLAAWLNTRGFNLTSSGSYWSSSVYSLYPANYAWSIPMSSGSVASLGQANTLFLLTVRSVH